MFVGLQTRWMSLISISAQSAALHAHPEATRSLQATSRIPPSPTLAPPAADTIDCQLNGPTWGRGGAGRGVAGWVAPELSFTPLSQFIHYHLMLLFSLSSHLHPLFHASSTPSLFSTSYHSSSRIPDTYFRNFGFS